MRRYIVVSMGVSNLSPTMRTCTECDFSTTREATEYVDALLGDRNVFRILVKDTHTGHVDAVLHGRWLDVWIDEEENLKVNWAKEGF